MRSVRRSAGSFEDWTPSTPMEDVPSGPFTSRRSGVAVSARVSAPRSTAKASGTPLDTLTIFCMSTKLWMGWPSIDATTSPGTKPARAAALSGCTAATRGNWIERPST